MSSSTGQVRARFPELVELDEPPRIIGHRCGRCHRVAFPPDPYGCEQCGADPTELTRESLAARGTVRALATVHRHHRPKPETPFTVATIVLEGGVTLKAVMDGDEGSLGVGSPVVGVIVPWETAEDGTEVVDLRFHLAESAGGGG